LVSCKYRVLVKYCPYTSESSMCTVML
jgi:hypothetical protein